MSNYTKDKSFESFLNFLDQVEGQYNPSHFEEEMAQSPGHDYDKKFINPPLPLYSQAGIIGYRREKPKHCNRQRRFTSYCG